MNLDDTLQHVHDELAAEVADGVRPPGFTSIRARHARRQRARLAAGGVVVAAVAVAGVVVAAPGGGHGIATVQPVTSVSASPTAHPTTAPTTAPAVAGVPPRGDAYVVTVAGSALDWTDLVTAKTGTFDTGAQDPGAHLNHPAVSADGRRLVWASQGSTGQTIETYDLDTQTHVTMRDVDTALQTPAISPDGSHLAWYDEARGGVVTAAFGTNQQTYPMVLKDVQQFSYDSSGSLVDVPADPTACALARTSGCLVTPTQLVAAVGAGWSIAEVQGSGATDSLAVGLLGPDQQTEIAVVSASGAVQPVKATLTPASVGQVNGGVLVDGGTRLAYAAQFVVDEKTLAPPVVKEIGLSSGDGGTARTVAPGGDLGFGLTAGP